MPVYHLTPIDLSHPDWEASDHKGECRVHAPDEDSAREYADEKFRKAGPWENFGGDTLFSPWTNPARVKCVEISDFDLSYYNEGSVETPDRNGHYPLYGEVSRQVTSAIESRGATATERNEGPYVAPQKSHAVGTSTEHDTAGPVTPVKAKLSVRAKGVAGIEVKVKRAVTPRVISRVVKNRVVLAFQTQSLLSFLDEVLEPVPGSNMGPLPLWAIETEEDKDAELEDLLRQLRDELRRFNDALESSEPNKENLSPVLSELQRVGLGFLKVAGGVFATGTGGLLVTAIGRFLDDAGLVSWKDFIELVKALRG